jgi:hypothetical protein
MAITLRGKPTETENNSATNSLTDSNTGQAISSGDCIVVCVRTGTTGAGNVTVADNVNAGNYIKAVEVVDTANGRSVGIYVKPNSAAVAAGSLTVTATLAGTASAMAMNGLIYIGVATTSPTDQTNSAVFATATTAPSSGNITTTVSGDAVIGAFCLQTTSLASVSSEGGSFAQEFNDTLGTTGHQHLHTADRVLTGRSTLAYAPTLSVAATGVIAVASFKPLTTVAVEDGDQTKFSAPAPGGSILLADEWTPRVATPPLFEWDETQRWQLNRDARVNGATGEIDTGLLPIIPARAWDEVDWQRWTDSRIQQITSEQDTGLLPIISLPPPTRGWDDWDWDKDFTEKRLWFESEALVGTPFLPSGSWLEESAAAFAGTSGSLAAMVMMDEFVNAPSGGTTFGPAPRGRSVRLGFSISAFR